MELDQVFRNIRDHAMDLKGIHAERDSEFDEYEKMYLLKFDAVHSKFQDQDIVKRTPSPSARNKVLNACRLMMSQDPVFSAKSSRWDDTKIEAIENNISRWWDQAGRAARRPLHYDMILSAVLYDEMHTAVTIMKDYQAYNKNDKRAERIGKMTPILFQSWNPRQGYPEFDELGLCSYYRESDVRWSYVAQKYKDLIEEKYEYVNKRATDNVTLKIFYDLTHYAIWIDNANQPLVCEEHGLPCIPIDVTMTNGSNFFQHEEDRRQPLLFAIKRSNLWQRESLLYTVLYSLLFSIGVSPTYVFKSDTEDDLDIQNDGALTYIKMKKGDTIETLGSKGILPPEVQQLSEMTTDLIDGASMYNTAFGEKNFNSQTFSETSLLQQAGRLPLIGPQRLGGFGVSSVVEMALALMKAKGLSFNRNGIRIKASEIPDDLEIKAKLDVILPQEKLQMVTVGLNMQKLGMPDEYIQNNLLGITNTKEIRKMFVQQQAEAAILEQKLKEKLDKISQAEADQQGQRGAQLQEAIQRAQAAQQQAAGPAAGNAANPQTALQGMQRQPALTQGQALEAQMLQQALQGGSGNRQLPPEVAGAMGQNGMPMQAPGAEMAGGLPGTMSGLLPGMGPGGLPEGVI